MDVLLLEVDIPEIEPHGLGASKARRVNELEQCAVADRERAARLAGRLDDRLDLCCLRGVGKAAPPLGRERDVRDVPRPEGESEQRADRREPPGCGRRRELAAGAGTAEV